MRQRKEKNKIKNKKINLIRKEINEAKKNNESLTIVTLDYSTTCTGIAIYNTLTNELKSTYFKRKTNVDKDMYNYELQFFLYKLFIEFNLNVNNITIVTEGNYIGGLNARVGMLLSYYRGGLLHVLNPSYYSEILPSEWRKAIGLKGNMARKEAKKEARNYFTNVQGFRLKTEDEAEAVCIMYALGITNVLYDHVDPKEVV